MPLSRPRTLLLLCFGLMLCLCQSLAPTCAQSLTVDVLCPHTPPLHQGRTSACWAFATASLLESEWLRTHGDTLRLSPMYAVRQKYLAQFDACCRTRGAVEITDGSLGHTFLRIASRRGLMPLEAYDGLGKDKREHDHAYLLQELRRLARKAVGSRRPQRYRRKAVALLDREMGPVARTFRYKGQTFTPRSFADSLRIDAADYVELTSFVRHPYEASLVLDVPDNWERASYYNLPMDTLVRVVCHALRRGYTVAWDGDVSEEGYDAEAGRAEWPDAPLTEDERQAHFDSHRTTDDHMMHIVGLAHDDKGRPYFILKNSYGTSSEGQGLVYMSQTYFRAKTVSVMLRRECLDFAQ